MFVRIVTIIALACLLTIVRLNVHGQDKPTQAGTAIVGWVELKERENIDGYFRKDNKIYCGEAKCNVKPLEVDIETFRIFPGSKYAKDKDRVYYPIDVQCITDKKCTVCHCHKYIIQDADPASFRFLTKDYAADSKSAYYRGKMIAGSDGSTFRVLEGPVFFYFAIDVNNVYMHNKIFKDADPQTFYFDNTAPESNERLKQSLIGDKYHRWIFTPPYHIKAVQ